MKMGGIPGDGGHTLLLGIIVMNVLIITCILLVVVCMFRTVELMCGGILTGCVE